MVHLQADADNDDAGTSRCAQEDVVDHARHADALEYHDVVAATHLARGVGIGVARIEHDVGTHRFGQFSTFSGELGHNHGSRTDPNKIRRHREADRTRANDDHRLATGEAGHVDGMVAHGHGLRQRGVFGVETRWHGHQ